MTFSMPELIWLDASGDLPNRMWGLSRWAALGTRLGWDR